jgi:hypothetical protein
MADVNVNSRLNDALVKRWTYNGSISIAGSTGIKFDTSKVKLRVLPPAPVDQEALNRHLVKTPTLMGEHLFKNSGNATLTEKKSYSKQVTDTDEWNIKSGLSLTAGAKVTVGVPLVGEAEASLSATVMLEGGQTNTHSETVTISYEDTIIVPARTELDYKVQLYVGTVKNVPFQLNLQAYGEVGVLVQWGSDQQIWMWADLDTGKGWVNPGLAPVKKIPLELNERAFVVEGDYSATVGLYAVSTTTPLIANAAAS